MTASPRATENPRPGKGLGQGTRGPLITQTYLDLHSPPGKAPASECVWQHDGLPVLLQPAKYEWAGQVGRQSSLVVELS